MLELLLTTTVFAAAGITLRSIKHRPALLDVAPALTDLPCPWCQGATTESDAECPSCKRWFGVPEPQSV